MKTLLCAFALLTASMAFAKSYSVTLYQNSILGATELKAGTYKLDLKDDKAIFTDGKKTAEAQAKVESAPDKFGSTTVRFQNGDGKYRIQEIRIGGTNMKVVFN